MTWLVYINQDSLWYHKKFLLCLQGGSTLSWEQHCMTDFSTGIADKVGGLKLLWLLPGCFLLPALRDSKVYSGNCLQLRPNWLEWKWYPGNCQCSNEMDREILRRERMCWIVPFGESFHFSFAGDTKLSTWCNWSSPWISWSSPPSHAL